MTRGATDAGYVIGSRLGHGATASVHQARRVHDDHPVVVKRAHATARAAAELDHEAQVLELLGRSGAVNIICLVERLVEPHRPSAAPSLVLAPVGTPLASLATTGPRLLDPVAITTLLLDIAVALASVHASGITHNDVSLSNIVFTDVGRAILIDFAEAGRPGTAIGPSTGTVPFVAPERLRNEGSGYPADVCALGLLGFRLWLGEVPSTRAATELIDRGCPPAVAALLVRATEHHPADRPTAATLATELRRAGIARHRPPPPAARHGGQPPTAPITREFGLRPPRPHAASHATRTRRHARRTGLAAAVMLILTLGIGGAAACRRDGGETVSAISAADPVDVVWDGAHAEAIVASASGTTRYQLGQPGDHLVVGDWDGDGNATPAVFRPSTGELFLFNAWATPDRPPPTATAHQTGVRGGRPMVRRNSNHDVVEIRP